MKSSHGIHWATPATMVSALLAGCLLAVGHHLFYHNLAGTAALIGLYHFAGAKVSKQQFNTAVGTAFAFVIKASLTAAVGMAYIQAFWRSAQVSRKGRKLSTLDTMFSVLGNALGLIKLNIWIKYPTLLLLAIIAWSIPLASIVTPATLSVESVLLTPSKMVSVPKFDFTSYDCVSPITLGGPSGINYSEYCYRGPNRLVQRVTTAVAAQGQVLPIAPPAANSSWSLDFWGPSLSCSNVTGTDRENILESIYDYFADGDNCDQSYGYISWVPAANNTSPFIAQNDTTTGNDVSYSQAPNTGILETATVLRCEFLNASYVADFNYVDGLQVINVTKNLGGEFGSVIPVDCVTGPMSLTTSGDEDYEAAYSYQANRSCSTLNLIGEKCLFNSDLVRTLSYQGIADAFSQLLRGTIGLGDASLAYPEVTFNSNIAKTIFLDTDDLALIRNWQDDSDFLDIASLSEISNGTDYLGLSNLGNVTSRGSLAHVLEEAFQNLTLSLLSEQYLQPNYFSRYAPTPQTNVTFQSYHNIYIYDWQTLWIAYGVALAFSAASVVVGLGAMLLNNASYSNNFSTVLRISKDSSMDTEIRGEEGKGREPLPKRLAEARVLMFRPEGIRREDNPVPSVKKGASSSLLESETNKSRDDDGPCSETENTERNGREEEEID